MNNWMREVDYATHSLQGSSVSSTLKLLHFGQCLTECAREGTVKPLKFEEGAK